jgi:hypothetical protein
MPVIVRQVEAQSGLAHVSDCTGAGCGGARSCQVRYRYIVRNWWFSISSCILGFSVRAGRERWVRKSGSGSRSNLCMTRASTGSADGWVTWPSGDIFVHLIRRTCTICRADPGHAAPGEEARGYTAAQRAGDHLFLWLSAFPAREPHFLWMDHVSIIGVVAETGAAAAEREVRRQVRRALGPAFQGRPARLALWQAGEWARSY